MSNLSFSFFQKTSNSIPVLAVIRDVHELWLCCCARAGQIFSVVHLFRGRRVVWIRRLCWSFFKITSRAV